jgi:hypothetical protein
MTEITDMTDEKLVAEGRRLFQHLHELIFLQGDTARARRRQRAAEDRLIEVWAEIGVGELTERFKSVIASAFSQARSSEQRGRQE